MEKLIPTEEMIQAATRELKRILPKASRDAAHNILWMALQAAPVGFGREPLVVDLPQGEGLAQRMYGVSGDVQERLVSRAEVVAAIEAAGGRVTR